MVWQFQVRKNFVAIQADEVLSKLLPKLKQEKEVLVFDKKKYLGFVNKRDIIRVGINLPEEKVCNLVFKPPTIYENTDELTIAKYFVETGAYYLPVLDLNDKNKILSVIYRDDFLKDVVSPYLKKIMVKEIPSKSIKTIRKEDNLAKALSLFQEFNISKLIVYNDKLEGIITLSNIITMFMHSTQVSKRILQNTLVKEVMKEDVITIEKSALVPKVINLFLEKNVSSVVVLDNLNLFGIITKTDLLERYIYLKEGELKQSSIQISAKFPELDKVDLEKRLSQLERFGKGQIKIFAYYKKRKEKFRGLPLINCRVRVIGPKQSFNTNVEGWGVEHATELAIKKLKRQMGEVSL